MTNKEALELLKRRFECRNFCECGYECDKCEFNWDTEKVDDAEELAIRALEKLINI